MDRIPGSAVAISLTRTIHNCSEIDESSVVDSAGINEIAEKSRRFCERLLYVMCVQQTTANRGPDSRLVAKANI